MKSRKLISIILCLTLLLCMAPSSFAWWDIHDGSIESLNLSLDVENNTIPYSETEDQYINLDISVSPAHDMDGISWAAKYPKAWSATKVVSTDDRFTYGWNDIGLTYAKATDDFSAAYLGWSTDKDDCMPYDDVSNLGRLTIKVPAGFEPGTYDIEVYHVELTTYPYGEIFESSLGGTVQLTIAEPAPEYDWDSTVWAGGLDFSWYDENNVQSEYHLTTPAQWEALAWICSERLSTLSDYAANTDNNVTAIRGTIPTTQNKFAGVQFYLDNDIDMGGVNDNGTWSGPNYYPIGSSCASDLAIKKETDSMGTVWYGLFYGSFDGQGHIVKNVYCDRLGASYSESQMCALFGRVGAADGTNLPDVDIVIKNVAVTGYINGGRSCGGVVGKTLSVASGRTVSVENCLNFASVKTNNGAKGVGGIVGALWNGGTVNNCANFGSVTGTYSSANAAGISGAAEAGTSNSYNVGTVINTVKAANSAAVALNQMSSAQVTNCYALEGSSPGYTTSISNGGVLVSGGWMTESEMKSASFVDTLNTDNAKAWAMPTEEDPILDLMEEYGVAGYPVPAVFATVPEVEETALTIITKGGTVEFTASELDELEETESTKSYTGKGGAAVSVTANYISFSDILAAAGVDPDAVSYPLTIGAADGFTRAITAKELPAMYLYKQEDGTYRSAMDGSAGRYWVSGVVSVEETGISIILKNATKTLTVTELDQLAGEESTKGYTGKSGTTSITANYISFSDILVTADVDADALSYPLTITAADGFTREITAEELPEMYLYKQEDGTYRSAMDGSAGRYWVSNVVSLSESTAEIHTVNYVDANGNAIRDSQEYSSAGAASAIDVSPLEKNGYDFIGWTLNEVNYPVDTDANQLILQEQVLSLIAEGSDVTLTAVYEKQITTYNVAVTGGTGSGSYQSATIVTVKAADPEEGKYFAGWYDSDSDTLLTVNPSYSFSVAKDRNLEARYADVEIEQIGTTVIESVAVNYSTKKVSFVSMSSVPNDATIVKAGIIATSNATVGTDADSFTAETAQYVRYGTTTAHNYKFTWTKAKVAEGQTWYGRSYLVYTDKNGSQHTVYGSIQTATMQN